MLSGMPKVKVPQFRSTRSVTVDPDATNGAVLGLNLWDETGELVDLDALVAQAIADAGGASSDGGTSPSGSDLTTDDVEEGRYNEYYTDARADARIAAHDTLPCFLSDGTPSYMHLASDLTIPCFLSDGTAASLLLAA